MTEVLEAPEHKATQNNTQAPANPLQNRWEHSDMAHIPKTFKERILQIPKDFSPESDTHINVLKKIYEKNQDLAEEETLESPTKYHLNNKNDNLIALVASKSLLRTAYYKLSKNKGALTPGTEEETSDGFSLETVDILSNAIKSGKFKWAATKRLWIPKPGKTALRPLNLNDFHNKLVQETIRMVLQVIFEPRFEKVNTNFGFRPNYSPHNSIQTIYENLSGKTFAIEGDIKRGYDNVDHDIMMKLLKRHVHDRKLLKLISSGLKTKIFDTQTKERIDPFLGIPQGGIVSPLLFNIYMHEFDMQIIGKVKTEYERKREGVTKSGHSKEYAHNKSIKDAKNKAIKRISSELTETGWKEISLTKKIRYSKILPELQNKILEHRKKRKYLMLKERSVGNYGSDRYKEVSKVDYPINKEELLNIRDHFLTERLNRHRQWVENKVKNPLNAVDYNKHPRVLIYNRYADDFVIITSGPLTEAREIKDKIQRILEKTLKLTLSIDKTKVTNVRTNTIKYLGFEVYLSKNSKVIKRKSDSAIQRAPHSKEVAPDRDRLAARFLARGFMDHQMNSKEVGILTVLEDHEIVEKYNQIIMGLGSYYTYTITRDSYLNKWHYILYYSCLKTLATKHKTNINGIIKVFGFEDLSILTKTKSLTDQRICINYKIDEELEWQVLINWKELIFRITRVRLNQTPKPLSIDFKQLDRINLRTKFRRSTMCTLCGSQEKIQVHHIKPIRANKSDKLEWNKIDLMNLGRKQIPVCEQCHSSIRQKRFKEINSNDLFCTRMINPETDIAKSVKENKKIIQSKEEKAKINHKQNRNRMKAQYLIVINRYYRSYYNPEFKQFLIWQKTKRKFK